MTVVFTLLLVCGLCVWLAAWASEFPIGHIRRIGGSAATVNASRSWIYAALVLAAIAGGLVVYVRMSTWQ